MLIIIEIIVGIVLYIMLNKINEKRIETNNTLHNISEQNSTILENIELYKKLKEEVGYIENMKFKDTTVAAKIYADQRKALVEFYTAKIENKTVYQDDHIKNITQSFQKALSINKNLKYKISKYEQLFPWIKQYENIDLSVATEEFYRQNNLPYFVNNQAEKLEQERILMRKKIEIEKDTALKKIQKLEEQASSIERDIEKKQKFANEQLDAIRVYYEHEEQEYRKRVNEYIHVEMMKVKNDRWRLNLDKEELLAQLEDKEQYINKKERELSQKEDIILARETTIQEQSELLLLKIKDIPVLAKHLAEIKEATDNLAEEQLRFKRNPAIKAADELSKIKKEKRELQERSSSFEYRLACYEQSAPWLVEIDEEPLDSKHKDIFNKNYDSKEDVAGYWLTKEEYISLSEQDKYQRALERYCRRNKTNLEIGRDYERYTGYIYESNGWKVEYRGIIDGFEDKGRDLICKKDGVTHIVQCKYWASKKTIHENYINQLFGTTVKYYLEQNPHASFEEFVSALLAWKTIKPIFRTSTTLSDTAKEFAKSLEIEVIENDKIKEYPMIKCNISDRNKEKIYHLPFDQQYDKVKIDKEGEFFAMTVKEAEEAGFRRAKRYYSPEK